MAREESTGRDEGCMAIGGREACTAKGVMWYCELAALLDSCKPDKVSFIYIEFNVHSVVSSSSQNWLQINKISGVD